MGRSAARRADPAPAADESGCRPGVVAGDHALRGYTHDIGNLRKRRRTSIAHDLEEMKGRWLVERETGNASGPSQSYVEGDAATVGMADKMDLVHAPVDEVDGPRRLVGQRESMRAGPGACPLTAVVLGSKQRVGRAEGSAELPPLTRIPRPSSARRRPGTRACVGGAEARMHRHDMLLIQSWLRRNTPIANVVRLTSLRGTVFCVACVSLTARSRGSQDGYSLRAGGP